MPFWTLISNAKSASSPTTPLDEHAAASASAAARAVESTKLASADEHLVDTGPRLAANCAIELTVKQPTISASANELAEPQPIDRPSQSALTNALANAAALTMAKHLASDSGVTGRQPLLP